MGEDSEVPPAPDQLIQVSSARRFRASILARATDASRGSKKALRSREHQQSSGVKEGGVPPKGLTGGWESDGVRAGPRLRPAPAAAAGTAPGVFAAPETGKAQQETSPPPKVP